MEQLRSRLVEEIECIETESKSMETFRNELDLLEQEKAAHLEELQQIQNDIHNVTKISNTQNN